MKIGGSFAVTGANPSAEEADEGVEDGAITVNNVVHSFRLQTTSFDKKSYLTYLKVYSTIEADLLYNSCLCFPGLYEGDQVEARGRDPRQGASGRCVGRFRDARFRICQEDRW